MRRNFARTDIAPILAGVVASLAIFAIVASPASAQTWPARNLTVIVPLAAGTGMDTLVRLYSERL